MIKVMTIFGTRPEAIKMAPVVKALEAQNQLFESVVCVTGQHREMLDQVLDLFAIKPDYDLNVMSPNQTLATLTSSVLSKLDPILAKEKPDWVLVQGDTTTAMTGSLAAFYRGAQIGHIEAGLRSNNRQHPFPEEINRRITSVVTDFHFAPTKWAADNLLREDHPRERVVVTGNTVIDAIHQVRQLPFDPKQTFSDDLIDADKKIVLVTAHRRENFGEGILAICSALRTLAETRDDIHIVYPVHLNPNIAEPVHRELAGIESITLLPPLEYQQLVWLMNQSYLILSDSGGIQEEAPGLGKPVLVLRETTERPEGVEAGTVRLVGANTAHIVKAATRLLDDEGEYRAMSQSKNPYGDGTAAEAILNALRGASVGRTASG